MAISRLEVPAAFWIAKAVVESAAFWDRKLPLNLLAPLKVWSAFRRATLSRLRVLLSTGVATGLVVPLVPVTGLMSTLGIQPAGVQTVMLLRTRPELLAKVLPPEAPRVPLAVKSPASCKMPEVGSATNWPRVSFLPLARTVSRFRLRKLPVVSVEMAWSAEEEACEDNWEEDAGEEGEEPEPDWKTLPRPKTPETRAMSRIKLKAIA